MFQVQPWSSATQLEKLQESLSTFYDEKFNHYAVDAEDLKRDKFFAARHTDGIWYRVRIDAIIDDNSVAVCFVDYGDVNIVTMDKLQILWREFRNLPMQAIKASLSGIQ